MLDLSGQPSVNCLHFIAEGKRMTEQEQKEAEERLLFALTARLIAREIREEKDRSDDDATAEEAP